MGKKKHILAQLQAQLQAQAQSQTDTDTDTITNNPSNTNTNTFTPTITLSGSDALTGNEFAAFTLNPNRADVVAIPIAVAPAETTLATVSLTLDSVNDRVWLNATVGVNSPLSGRILTYKFYRNAIVAGTEILSTRYEIEGGSFENDVVNHFSHVDSPTVQGAVSYILTVQATAAGANVIGPLTFTAAEV